jgi:hypothetical protein
LEEAYPDIQKNKQNEPYESEEEKIPDGTQDIELIEFKSISKKKKSKKVKKVKKHFQALDRQITSTN